MLTPEQVDKARALRIRAKSPAEIAQLVGAPLDDVRALLEADGTAGRRPRLEPTPLKNRPALATDLLDLAQAAAHLGVCQDTVRRSVDRLALPYRDALGRLTEEPYSARWCRFSRREVDRWLLGERSSPVEY